MERTEPYTELEIIQMRAKYDEWFALFDKEKECNGCGEMAYCYTHKLGVNVCIKCANTLVNYNKQNNMKTAQIEAVEVKNTWTSKRGDTMYTHTITLSNGETGDINAKSELPDFLKVGETINYNSMEDKFGKKFTRIQLQDPGTSSPGAYKKGQDWEDPERQKKIVRQSSLAQAVNYFTGKNATDGQVLALAEKFESWVNR